MHIKPGYKITIAIAASLLCLCTGCSGKNEKNDSTASSTLLESTADYEPTTATATDAAADITTDTQEHIEEVVYTIAQSDYAIKDYPADEADNLYTLHMENIPDDAWISSISECGSKVLVMYYEYDTYTNASDYYLKLVNPLTLEESDSLPLPEGVYAESDVYTDADDRIMVVNTDAADVYIFNDSLEESKDISLGNSYISSYCLSNDSRYIYYMFSYGNDIYRYDTVTDEVCTVCESFTPGDTEYAYISGFVAGEETDYILLGTTDYEIGEVTYNLYDVSTGNVFNSTVSGVAYATKLEYIEGDSDNYLAKCNVDGVTEIVSCGNVLSLSDYDEYYYVNDDLADRKVISTLSDYDEESDIDTFNLKVYDLDTGLIENESEFTFTSSDYSYMYAGNTLYMKDLNLVVWQAADSKNGIFVWDLAEVNSQSEDTTSHLYTWEDLISPDKAEMEKLRQKAERIGQEAGVEIYIGDDVSQCTITTYKYTPVNNAVRIDKALDIMERELSRYPDGMLAQLDDSYGSALKIYLSGKILPISDDALSTAVGVQDTLEDDTWMVLDITTTIDYTRTIHHEIFHAVELHMINEGFYFDYDTWYSFNPEGFDYDYGYDRNDENANYDYVTGDVDHVDEISFIDRYSKSMPNEDRARIVEYAMAESEHPTGYFEYKNIHNKLEYISSQIRKCFDTTGWPEVTEWEKCLYQE